MSEGLIRVLVDVASAAESASATAKVAALGSPELPQSFDITKRTIACMMRENTGASILDSGGAYGRAWERNAAMSFWEKPRCSVEFRAYERTYGKDAGTIELEANVTIDLFHFLTEKLEYDRAMSRQFAKFAGFEENSGKHWPEIMASFPEWIADKRETDCEVLVNCANSYNEDNFLSGTIQFTLFSMDHEQYCILQIHGGCDVRGGYTDPKVFRCTDEWSVCDYYRASIAPNFQEVKAKQAAQLEAINAKAWLFESERIAAIAAIEDGQDLWFDVGGNDDHGEGYEKRLSKYPVIEIESREQWEKGKVCVLPDHTALCPVTGVTLEAGWF